MMEEGILGMTVKTTYQAASRNPCYDGRGYFSVVPMPYKGGWVWS